MLKRSLMGLLALVLAIGLFVANPLKAEAASSFKSSDDLIGVLKKMEGFSKKPYWDVSQWTVGYGTRCPDDKLEQYKKDGITEAQATELLEKDLASREKKVNSFIDKYELKLKQHQFDALVSFTYNCGTGWLSETDGFFNNAVRSGDLSNDFLYGICLWSSAGGEYILINRRMCEANMYINGVYKASNSGDEDLFPDNFRWVFLDGNGGEVHYKMHAFDSKKPRGIQAELTKIPTYTDAAGNTVKYTLVGWFTEDGKLVEKLDDSVEAGQVLYAKWKDAEGNIVEVPRGKKPSTDQVIITGDEVNVRSGPGTFYEKVGKVYEGDVLTITEVYEGNGYTWGKFSKGWVSLTYADYIYPDMCVAITKQPKSVTVADGQKATISLTATGDGLKYQWYYKYNGKFVASSGTGKATYSITMTQARAGRDMYCVITDKYGNSVQSDTVTLGMELSVTKQPVSDGAPVGKKVNFSFVATGAGLTYQWYYKDKDATEYTLSSCVKTSYSTTMTERLDGRTLYCVVTDKFGNSVKTNTVTMHLGATITKQPVSDGAPVGKKVNFSFVATGAGLTYQWYYKDKDAAEYTLSSCVKTSYSTTMTERLDGRTLYCIATDKFGNSVKTNTVTMHLGATITKQPVSDSAPVGKKVNFSFVATGAGLTYQWYYKDKDAAKYTLSSCVKTSYSTTMTERLDGRTLYCVVTDKFGNSVKTNTVTMHLGATITKQPVSDSAPVGKKVNFSFVATGAGLTYQWYYKDKDAAEYTLSSCVKTSYSTTMTERLDGRTLYCVVTDKFGNSVKTNTVTMHLGATITQ